MTRKKSPLRQNIFLDLHLLLKQWLLKRILPKIGIEKHVTLI